MTTRQWKNITDYMDTVGTTLKTFTFNKTQNLVQVTIRGNANVTYTIGSQSGTLTPGQSISVSELITSFTLTAVSGTQTVEVWAIEDGTQKVEDDNSDSISGLTASFADITTNATIEHLISKMINGQAVKIICDGDSVTWGKDGSAGTQVATPYPSKLQSLLQDYYQNPNITVINNGISGKNSAYLATNISTVTAQNPDLVIVMVGLNDKQGYNGDGTFSTPVEINTYIENLKTIRKAVMNNGGRVLFVSPTPCYSKSSLATINDLIQKQMTDPYVKAMESYCKREGFEYYDLRLDIEKYLKFKLARYTEVSGDAIHWNQIFYNHLAECIFAKQLVATDITVKNELKHFTATSPFHKFLGGIPSFFTKDLSTNNTYAQFGGVVTHYAYVFIDALNMNCFLTGIKGTAGEPSCSIAVDGGTSLSIDFSSPSDAIWGLDYLVQTLTYGLHKIVLNTTSTASTHNILMQNIHFDVVPAVTDRSLKVNKKLVSATISNGTADTKFVGDLPFKQTHYRFYTEINNQGGFSIGRQQYWNSGVVNTYNTLFFFFKNGNMEVHRLLKTTANVINSNPTFSQITVVPLSKTFVNTSYTFTVIDLVISATNVQIYVDGTLAYTITDMLLLGGALDLNILNYTSTTYGVTTIIQNIYDNVESLSITNGEEYIDDTANQKKCYINGTWVALN